MAAAMPAAAVDGSKASKARPTRLVRVNLDSWGRPSCCNAREPCQPLLLSRGLNGLNGLSLLCRRPGNGPWIDRWPKSDSLYRRPWFVTPSFGSLVATDPLSDDGKPGLAKTKAEKTTTRSVQPEQNTVRNLINSHISYLKHRFKDA